MEKIIVPVTGRDKKEAISPSGVRTYFKKLPAANHAATDAVPSVIKAIGRMNFANPFRAHAKWLIIKLKEEAFMKELRAAVDANTLEPLVACYATAETKRMKRLVVSACEHFLRFNKFAVNSYPPKDLYEFLLTVPDRIIPKEFKLAAFHRYAMNTRILNTEPVETPA